MDYQKHQKLTQNKKFQTPTNFNLGMDHRYRVYGDKTKKRDYLKEKLKQKRISSTRGFNLRCFVALDQYSKLKFHQNKKKKSGKKKKKRTLAELAGGGITELLCLSNPLSLSILLVKLIMVLAPS